MTLFRPANSDRFSSIAVFNRFNCEQYKSTLILRKEFVIYNVLPILPDIFYHSLRFPRSFSLNIIVSKTFFIEVRRSFKNLGPFCCIYANNGKCKCAQLDFLRKIARNSRILGFSNPSHQSIVSWDRNYF